MTHSGENWFQANPGKARWLLFLLCFAFVELLCRALVAGGLLYHETYPTTRKPGFWAYIDPVVGMWRYPNATLHHVTDCIDQTYRTNSAGARDPERSLRSSAERRIVVLGDSMVEGHGAAFGDRMTDILERRTGLEHLNFGTSGHFGTIQEWLLYDAYASAYDHTDVLVFILPANDFEDNDIREFGARTYRPYLRERDGNPDELEVYYPVAFDERDVAERRLSTVVKNVIDNNVYIFNALRVGMHMLKDSVREGRPAAPVATYDNFSDQDMAYMLHALDGIVKQAEARRVFLFTIPAEGDAQFVRRNGYDFELVKILNDFADRQANVQFTDLLPGFLAYADAQGVAFRDFSLGCDPHWSPLGARVAADLVYESVYRD